MQRAVGPGVAAASALRPRDRQRTDDLPAREDRTSDGDRSLAQFAPGYRVPGLADLLEVLHQGGARGRALGETGKALLEDLFDQIDRIRVDPNADRLERDTMLQRERVERQGVRGSNERLDLFE